eukprot:111527-Rhodomonas_salina.1
MPAIPAGCVCARRDGERAGMVKYPWRHLSQVETVSRQIQGSGRAPSSAGESLLLTQAVEVLLCVRAHLRRVP